MEKHHWKKIINPDYLGAYSLDDGNGGYLEIAPTIQSVRNETVTGTDGKKEECMVMRFVEKQIGPVEMKPMIVNVTNAKTLEKLFQSPYIEDWAKRKITIGVEKVKAFGDVVDSLRIKKTLPKSYGPTKCFDCGNEIKSTEKMSLAQVIAYSRKKFGKDLCTDCMKSLAEAQTQKTEEEFIQKAIESVQTESNQSEPEQSEFDKMMKENQ